MRDLVPRSTMLWLVVGGPLLGAASGWAAFLASGRFEPYDSGVGLFANQAVLALPAMWLACRGPARFAFACLLGAYLGMNGYAYVFGGSESRAWAALGALTSALLMLLPGLLAAAIAVIRRLRQKPSTPASSLPAVRPAND